MEIKLSQKNLKQLAESLNAIQLSEDKYKYAVTMDYILHLNCALSYDTTVDITIVNNLINSIKKKYTDAAMCIPTEIAYSIDKNGYNGRLQKIDILDNNHNVLGTFYSFYLLALWWVSENWDETPFQKNGVSANPGT